MKWLRQKDLAAHLMARRAQRRRKIHRWWTRQRVDRGKETSPPHALGEPPRVADGIARQRRIENHAGGKRPKRDFIRAKARQAPTLVPTILFRAPQPAVSVVAGQANYRAGAGDPVPLRQELCGTRQRHRKRRRRSEERADRDPRKASKRLVTPGTIEIQPLEAACGRRPGLPRQLRFRRIWMGNYGHPP